MNRAERAASTISHESATLAPAPAATPLTAQMTGFASAADRAHQRVPERIDRLAEIRCLATFALHAIGKVLARAEALAGAREQHRPHAIIARAGQRFAQRAMHLLVERIELVRPVQRDGAHAGQIFNGNGGARGHCAPPGDTVQIAAAEHAARAVSIFRRDALIFSLTVRSVNI